MKKLVSIRMDLSIHDRIMRIVYWTPGLTFNKVVNKLLEEYIEKCEENRGSKFPERVQ